MKISSNQKGITLIALIFTIIILLIISVVSIKSIVDWKIFSKTKSAKELYSQAEEEEMVRIAANNAKIDGNSKIQTNYLTSTLNEQFGDDWEIIYMTRDTSLLANYKNKEDRIYLAQTDKKLYGMIVEFNDNATNWIIKIKSSQRKYQIANNADVNFIEKDASDLPEMEKVGMAAYEAKKGRTTVDEETLKTALTKYFNADWEMKENGAPIEDLSSNENRITNKIKLSQIKKSKINLLAAANKLGWGIKIKSTGNEYYIYPSATIEKLLVSAQ